METEVIKIDRDHPDMSAFEKAGRILKEGGLVAFPTETVYGLGADALDEEASRKIYEAKGRPSDNPLIVHIARMEDLEKIVKKVPEEAVKLAQRYWPGPMTLIMEKSECVPYGTTGGLDTVAVRMPSDPVARELILQGGGYVAAPSANTSGRPSPTTARHVYEDMEGKIPLILDGGPVEIGLESTIVDLTERIPTILRPGYITLEMVREVLGEVQMDKGLISSDSSVRPKAPGMKYKHYAPKAEMIIFRGDPQKVRLAMAEEKMYRMECGQKVGIIMYGDDQKEAAHDFFAQLRAFDKSGVDVILAAAVKEDGIGFALMNRMFKSAGYNIREVE